MNDVEPFQRAHAAALRLLSYRPRSEAEVRTRLRRNFTAHLVERVLEALRKQDLIDDSKFARQWRESRESLKPRSAWAIKRELMAKGVDTALADQAVWDVDDGESAYRAALGPARKLNGVDLPTFRRRLWGYLKRRGFSDSDSRLTINRLWEEMESGSRP